MNGAFGGANCRIGVMSDLRQRGYLTRNKIANPLIFSNHLCFWTGHRAPQGPGMLTSKCGFATLLVPTGDGRLWPALGRS